MSLKCHCVMLNPTNTSLCGTTWKARLLPKDKCCHTHIIMYGLDWLGRFQATVKFPVLGCLAAHMQVHLLLR